MSKFALLLALGAGLLGLSGLATAQDPGQQAVRVSGLAQKPGEIDQHGLMTAYCNYKRKGVSYVLYLDPDYDPKVVRHIFTARSYGLGERRELLQFEFPVNRGHAAQNVCGFARRQLVEAGAIRW